MKGAPATAIQYPATILCPKLEQGKPCEDFAKPEGCPYMHPEDGLEVMRKTREEQLEHMKTKTEGKLIPPHNQE